MKYVFCAENIATGAVADTFKTMLATITPNTNGLRHRMKSLSVGFADDAPADRNVAIQVKRIASVSGGTAGTATTVTTTALGKKDTLGPDTSMVVKKNYTVEPTTYEAESLFAADLNDRNGIQKEWSTFDDDAPVAQKDQHLGILAAPRAAFASTLTICAEIEQF